MAGPGQGGVRSTRTMRSKVLRCIAIASLFLFIAIATIVLVMWLIIKPEELSYTIEDGSIRSFSLTNNTLNAAFDLSLRAYNPNYRIAVYYDYVELSVWFDDQMIGFRNVPPFFQPHHNATRIEVEALAQSVPLLGSVATDLKNHKLSRGVEVVVRLNGRIRFKMGTWKSRKQHLRVYCSPVVLYQGSSKFDRTYCDVDI